MVGVSKATPMRLGGGVAASDQVAAQPPEAAPLVLARVTVTVVGGPADESLDVDDDEYPLCSFCGRERPVWLHDLDPDKTRFRKYGKGNTLSTWWALCQVCEDAYQSGDEDRAVGRMMVLDSEWNIDWHMAERTGTTFDLVESVRKPLRVFRAADRGRRRIRRRGDTDHS